MAELLEAFAERGGDWEKRLRYMTEGGNLEKSRRFFDLFLRLLDEGTLDDAKDRFVSNGTFWSLLHGLAEERPDWCAELAAHWLDRQLAIARLSRDGPKSPRSLLNDDFGVNDLFTSARQNPVAFLEHVLPAVLRMATAFAYCEDEEKFPRDQVWPSRFRGEHIGLSEAYLGACETALELVGQQSLDALRQFVTQLAIAKYSTEKRMYDFEHPERGGAWELARMLQDFVKEQPERFARLALRFPDDSEPSYFMNVFCGLKEAAISSKSKLAVVRRIFGTNHHGCLCAALDLLGLIADTELPEDMIQFIRQAAEYPDPEAEIRDGDTVRGHAAEAIRDLVLGNSRYLAVFSTTIEKLTDDPSLAVRACVASTLAAVARHDTPLALRLMDRLLNTDDRLLSTLYVGDFIRKGLRKHYEHFASTIQRMLRSKHEEVRKVGGMIACLARLCHERADSLSEAALSGDEHCRLGACKVAESNLLYPECRVWCEAALSRLFNDENKTVRSEAAGCFWHLWHSTDITLTNYETLIRSFLASPAFADEPTYLLHALEETRHRVPEVLLDVCEAFVRRCSQMPGICAPQ